MSCHSYYKRIAEKTLLTCLFAPYPVVPISARMVMLYVFTRYQMMLEKKHDEFSEVQQVRKQEEQQLDDVRNMYKDLQFNANTEKKRSKWTFWIVSLAVCMP